MSEKFRLTNLGDVFTLALIREAAIAALFNEHRLKGNIKPCRDSHGNLKDLTEKERNWKQK